MFRIYAGKENKPASYSPENVPYVPKYSLPVSIKGFKESDYAMIMGFPGRTNRYEFSQGIKLAQDQVNPAIVALRDIRLKAWKEVMDKSEKDRLALSSLYAGIANYWKYFIGQTEQLKRLKVFDYKMELEQKFSSWASTRNEYASVLPNVAAAYNTYVPFALQRTYLNEGILSVNLFQMAGRMILSYELAKDTGAANKAIADMKKNVDGMYETFFPPADEKILRQVLVMYYNNIPKDQHPEIMEKIMSKGKTPEEACAKYAEMIYRKSMFVSKDKFLSFLAKPSVKALNKDIAYQVVSSFYKNYTTNYKSKVDEFGAVVAKEGRTYIKGLMEMQPEKTFYPDANSSLRLTYGTVQSYDPRDAVHYSYFTTLEGVFEKYNPKDFEFNVPSKLIELHDRKDYGEYALPDGRMPVAFITNNDITGGNSGSPVINGDGQLIGLAFDGNWEAMSGDIVYDDKYKRTINVDIRYVMFLIDKYGGAKNIISEVTLVR